MKEKKLNMTVEGFAGIIEGAKAHEKKLSDLLELGVDLLAHNDDYYRDVVHPLMVEAFGEDKVEMIDWYINKRKEEWGKEAAKDKDGNPICYDLPSLYKYVEA